MCSLQAKHLRTRTCPYVVGYGGDGWFRYDITLHDDPFFHSYGGFGLLVEAAGFTGFGSIPEGWQTFVAANGQVQVFTNAYPAFIARPLSATIWIHSSNTAYKTVDTCGAEGAATCKFNGQLKSPYESENIGYVLQMRSIVPCPPAEADGSASNCVDMVEIFSDLQVDGFVNSNGVPRGLSFSWDRECTALVRTSDDLVHWTAVEHFLFSPPKTDWIASSALTSLGTYFKADIASLQHEPGLLSSATANLCAEATTNNTKDTSCNPQITLTPSGIRIAPREPSSDHYLITLYEDRKGHMQSNSLSAGPDGITLPPRPSPGTRAVFVSIQEVEEKR